LAQDIVQQAAVVGLENLGDFRAGTSFVSWMVRIVKNIALNEARRRVRHRTSAADPVVLDESQARSVKAAGAEDPAITDLGQVRMGQMEFDDAVMNGLRQLDETARACLLMRVVLDMPYHNISLALDIPEGTAASHVHRARAAMRAHLKGPKGGGT
jgi:RNA polymerase sigma-70 factor (ECF subfamily)